VNVFFSSHALRPPLAGFQIAFFSLSGRFPDLPLPFFFLYEDCSSRMRAKSCVVLFPSSKQYCPISAIRLPFCDGRLSDLSPLRLSSSPPFFFFFPTLTLFSFFVAFARSSGPGRPRLPAWIPPPRDHLFFFFQAVKFWFTQRYEFLSF